MLYLNLGTIAYYLGFSLIHFVSVFVNSLSFPTLQKAKVFHTFLVRLN